MLTTRQFLETVITTPSGYFCLAVRSQGNFLEQWYHWPEDADKIVERAQALMPDSDVYFSSYLFKAPQSIRENVLPSRTIQADLDDADVSTLPKDATVLVETSPGRHQGFWVLDTALPLEEHEALSRKLTYSIPLCDRSGWALGRKVRIPGTLNHKYSTGPKGVLVVGVQTNIEYSPEQFDSLPDVPAFLVEHYDPDFLDNPVGTDEHPLEILERIKGVIPTSVYVQYSIRQRDRSASLWAEMCWGFKAGLSRQEVFTLAKGSANNKFGDLRYRGDQELAKDVLRAEHTTRSETTDPKQLIVTLYKSQIPVIERKRQIFSIVLQTLKEQGDFYNSSRGVAWYIRRDLGRPVILTPRSEALGVLLDIQFGLNSTEPETRYVKEGIVAYAHNLPETATVGALSYYDPNNQHLLLHTGAKTVLRITARGVESLTDGAYGVVFPWSSSSESFDPITRSTLDWGDELFGHGERGFGSSVENIANMTPGQARALLKVWLLFVLFRNVAYARPVIASFGQPGSGKTTLFRKVYALLYGRWKSLSSITNMDDFDHSTANDPLVILDNVDSWQSWLPDRIAVSAGTSDIMRRKLYTDTDTITLRRQAIIGVTAHNPKFGREDVADRFLLFIYNRLGRFVSEEEIVGDILRKRNLLWGSLVRDIIKVLKTPIPIDNIPQFRIEDFARFGLWIARAIGEERDFRTSIEDVKTAQQAFTLEEEGILVSAVRKFARQNSNNGTKFYTASQMWPRLEAMSEDSMVFSKRYTNSIALSKKLLAMEPALKRIVVIEQGRNEMGTRTWRITSLPEENGNDN